MLKSRNFKNLRAWTHGVDTELFQFHASATDYALFQSFERPIALFVGRISYEKNIEAFLKLDLPGTKVVCGVGPLEVGLKQSYPNVKWLGLLHRQELAQVYAASDVFVFPSKSETFGLVMLEAMSTGTPVAAYPVDGPLEVLAFSGSCNMGGVMHIDLKLAVQQALTIARCDARNRAMAFSWLHAAKLFESHLAMIEKHASNDLSLVQITEFETIQGN